MQTRPSFPSAAPDPEAAPYPASRIEALGIVIPVHNGADAVAHSINRIFGAISHAGWQQAVWLVVVADTCTDDTAKVGRRLVGSFGQTLEISARSADVACRAGAGAVFEHFHRKARHAILLTYVRTGAELPAEWIGGLLTSDWPH